MEQVAEAALDVHSLDFACSVVYKIRGKFPNSQRAQRLTVMILQPPLQTSSPAFYSPLDRRETGMAQT